MKHFNLCQRVQQRNDTTQPSNGLQNGFTIIEIMIATTVFAVILVVLTVGLLQVTRIYYKGITSNKTQETSRSIMDDISRSIQFNGGAVTSVQPAGAQPIGTQFFFCVGNTRYTFIKGQKLDSSNAHVLVKDTLNACSSSSGPADWAAGWGSLTAPVELMFSNMRLAKLTVGSATAGGLSSVNVKVVAGDDDLLCSPSAVPAECDSSSISSSLLNDDIRCKDFRAGTQFCAVSELATTVQKRI